MNNKNLLYYILLLLLTAYNLTIQLYAQQAPGDQGEPFNIGQQLIVQGKIWIYQNQLFYFQFDNGNITLHRTRIAYGFSDAFGVEVTLPYFIKFKEFDTKSRGVGDVRILGQWNYYRTPEHLATIRAGIEAPTGSTRKTPAPGFGSVSYVVNVGFIHSSYKWYAEYFILGFKRSRKNNLNPGSEIFFNANIGPKIHFNHGESKLFTLIQLRNIYEGSSKTSGIKDLNTGSLVSLLGPLISYRHKSIILEGTAEFPINQRYNGIQDHLQWLGTLTFQLEF